MKLHWLRWSLLSYYWAYALEAAHIAGKHCL